MIHAGEATNVIPDTCELQGTVRTFTLEVLDMIEQRMQEIAEHTSAAFGMEPANSASTATTRPPSTRRPRPSSRAR
jgi:metal-dependent amidase/aminoacylase/carboxypeptidase family protein